MSDSPILEVRGVTCEILPGQPLFQDINFTVNEGDVIIVQGKSGSGKTTLLKCISHLVLYKGDVLYRGRVPHAYGLQDSKRLDEDDDLSFPTLGIPAFRTRVLYVPQRPSLLPGTPRDFLYSVAELKTHQAQKREKPEKSWPHKAFRRASEMAQSWGVDAELWQREWSNLSGGEAQRMVLAVALALDTAEVLLLDEPTSALDAESASLVEEFLINEVKEQSNELKALIWITHSEEQARRVGTRFLNIFEGGCREDPNPLV